MKCPHCLVEVHPDFARIDLNPRYDWVGYEEGLKSSFFGYVMQCPACSKAIIQLEKLIKELLLQDRWTIYPRAATRPPAPKEVPPPMAEDYNEAAAVMHISPKASAALSRRCLQAVLRDQGYDQRDLAPAIDAAISSGLLPAGLADNLDAIRNIGNFAAHPLKDQQTGSILAVEPHEAEWNLEVLESLFDHYYVQPAKSAARRAALDVKLQGAGKPAMKVPTQ